MSSKPFKRVILLKGLSKVVVALRLSPGRIEKKEAVGFGARNRQLFSLQHVAPELVSRGEIAASGQSHEEQ